MDERAYLKVKIKSLAEEAKIIRMATRQARQASIRDGLAAHRKGVVRYEARHTHLAYGFLRGREYRRMEQKARQTPDWAKVRRMVERYGSHNEVAYSWSLNNIDEYRAACEATKKHLEETLICFDKWVGQAKTVLAA